MSDENKKANPIYSETAYDDAFKTMQGECDDLVIPFVNHMFDENYDRTAVIKRLQEEHHSKGIEGSDQKRVSDSTFEIIFANVVKKYHIECESKKYDGTILVRIFEYDTQISMDDAEKSTDTIRLKFPYSGLLLLRSSNSAPKKAKIEVELPGGQTPFYEVPIISVSDYSIDDIFKKKLYMLIPFYAFKFENELDEINGSEERLKTFIEMYGRIFDELKQALENDFLSALSYSVIIRLTHSVIYKLTMKQDNVHKKVGEVMGGKVLDLPEIRLYKQAKAEGRSEGRAEAFAEVDQERKRLEKENLALKERIAQLEAERAAN